MKKYKKIGIVLLLAVGLLMGNLVFVAVGEHNAQSQVLAVESDAQLPGTVDSMDSTELTESTEIGTEIETETEEQTLVLDKPEVTTVSKPNGVIKIKWSKVSTAVKYVLYRSEKKDGKYSKLCTQNSKTLSYLDKTCTVGKVYYYKVFAYAENTEVNSVSKIKSGRSLKQVEITAISNVTGSRKLVLFWNPVKGADSYKILRQNRTTGEFQEIATVKGSKASYTDKKRTGGVTYTYKVCALDGKGGRGSYSKKMSQMAIDKKKKMIALTYDDGPSIYTPVVLDALEKYEAHATFFVLGNRADSYQDYLRQEVELGCEIGNHTYGHEMLRNRNTSQIQSVLSKTNSAVKKQTGVDIHIMRPPGGSYNSTVCDAADMPVILWSIDTLDWKTRDTSATIQCVKNKAYDGAIVLMHDIHKPTVNAADDIMSYLKQKGYQMVTVSEMAAYRGGMKDGKTYSQFRK